MVEPTSRLRRWQLGFGVILRGRSILQRFPLLRRHFWRPVIFNTLLSTLTFLIWLWVWWTVTQWTVGTLTVWLEPLIWGPLLVVVHVLSILILGIACALLAVVIWRFLQGVLLGPIYADLSLRVEEAIGIPTDDLKGGSWLQAIPDTLIQIALLITLQLLSFVVNGLPLIGSIIATVLNFCGTTSLLGLDLFAFPLSARGVSRWQQLRYMNRQSWYCSGVGTGILLSQAIPILGGLLTTYAVIGCTELFHEVEDEVLACMADEKRWQVQDLSSQAIAVKNKVDETLR